MDFTVREAQHSDVERIAEIDALCFSEPDSVQTVRGLLDDASAKFFVLEVGKNILSYCSALTVLDEIQIINVATAPGYTSKGYGFAVLKKMLSYAAECGAVSASLEVRRSNAAAVALYRKCGFVTVGERKNFYRKPTEDALIMTAKI